MFLNKDGYLIISRYRNKDRVAIPIKELHEIVFYEDTGYVAYYKISNGVISGLFQPNKVQAVYASDGIGVKYEVLEELVD